MKLQSSTGGKTLKENINLEVLRLMRKANFLISEKIEEYRNLKQVKIYKKGKVSYQTSFNSTRQRCFNYAWDESHTEVHMHKDTPSNLKITRRICTWNVQTMYATCKTAQAIKKMRQYCLVMLGISKCRWIGSGKIKTQTGETIILEDLITITVKKLPSLC